MTQEAAIEPQEELNEILEEEAPETNEEETEEVSEETEEVAETEEIAEGEETEEIAEEKPKKKGKSLDERKKELASKTWEMREQERVTQAAIAELKKLQEQVEVVDAPKPKSEDYDTHEEYQESLMDWTAKNAVNQYAKKELEKKTVSTEEKIESKRNDDWNFNREKGLKKYKNFAENEGMLTKVLQHYQDKSIYKIIMDSDKDIGYELVQHLGKNWEDAERICQLSELGQAMEIGAIKERLVNRPKKKPTKVYTPTSKVRAGGGGGASSKANPSDTLAWMDERNKQERG